MDGCRNDDNDCISRSDIPLQANDIDIFFSIVVTAMFTSVDKSIILIIILYLFFFSFCKSTQYTTSS